MVVHTDVMRTRTPQWTTEERFWAKVTVGHDLDCWPWTGSGNENGYGSFRIGAGKGRLIKVHRYSYELFHGNIQKDLVIDHLCHKPDGTCPGGRLCFHRRCVNPRHLEAVTQAENLRRGLGLTLSGSHHARKTTCPYGHEYAGDNLYLVPSTGYRMCRTCSRESSRRCRANLRSTPTGSMVG